MVRALDFRLYERLCVTSVPVVPLSDNRVRQVVHTYVRASVHQAAWTGAGLTAKTLCGWEGNRGHGREYWQPPPGVHVCS